MSYFKLNALLKIFTLLKLPVIAFINPKVIRLDNTRCEIKVKLGYRTRNHLNVMYFGALAVGAELSVGVKTLDSIQKSGKKIDFLFKNFSCQFLKRADAHVHFICEQASLIEEFIQQASQSNERLEKDFSGFAILPSQGEEPIMTYKMTLSVRNRSPL